MAANIEYLEKTRQGLRERIQKSPLSNTPLFVRDIENVYQDMWSKYLNLITLTNFFYYSQVGFLFSKKALSPSCASGVIATLQKSSTAFATPLL